MGICNAINPCWILKGLLKILTLALVVIALGLARGGYQGLPLEPYLNLGNTNGTSVLDLKGDLINHNIDWLQKTTIGGYCIVLPLLLINVAFGEPVLIQELAALSVGSVLFLANGAIVLDVAGPLKDAIDQLGLSKEDLQNNNTVMNSTRTMPPNDEQEIDKKFLELFGIADGFGLKSWEDVIYAYGVVCIIIAVLLALDTAVTICSMCKNCTLTKK